MEIIRILMNRDDITEDEAIQLINDTREEMMEALMEGDQELAEEIWHSNLGLELDYIVEVM